MLSAFLPEGHNVDWQYSILPWTTPPFIKPEKLDVAVKDWTYVELTKGTNIILDEEVDHEIFLGEINYNGELTPQFGEFRVPNNNYLLGGVIKKNTNNRYGIYITKKQDYETEIMRAYRFEIVIGTDSYGIALNIRNIDDNAPVIQSDERNCAVEENYSGRTNCSFTIHDADGWIDKVHMTFTSMQEEGEDNFKFQIKEVSGIDKDYSVKAYLDVVKPLDFESIAMYMLTMNATDEAGNVGNLLTAIEVIDMPDESPKWTRLTASETIIEKSTKTFGVLAIDGDVQINAEINYKIITADGEENFFTVDTTTGIITIHEINRDEMKRELFRFQIIAYEKNNITSMINATIIVIVEDKNDNIPEISPDKLSIDIDEETYMTLDFKQSITISDIDLAENAQYSVRLIDDSIYHWSTAYQIVPNNGYQTNNFTISVVNASLLDYEDENWRNMKIKIKSTEVANESHIDEIIIEINLINWNDELPIFQYDTIQVSVPEDVEKGSYIATMLATDRDVDDNVTLTLVAQEALSINEKSGKIVTALDNSFDYELMPIVIVQIVATDLVKHKTYATLTINVTDVNDVPPVLNLPKRALFLEEEVNNGTVIDAEIEASDVDTDAKLIFSIDWDDTIARKSGVIVNQTFYREHLKIQTNYQRNNSRLAQATLIVTGRIDYEAFDVISINIIVHDLTTVHNENFTSGTVTINIIDINDNYPEFKNIEMMSVSENQVTDTLIGAITATDADGAPFNQISYYIKSINNTADDLIQINNKSGLAIYVNDMNDEVPYHDKFNSTIHIKEKSPSGTKIVRISGKDNDRTSPYNNVSYLINTNYSAPFQYFNLGRFDGLLQVNLIDGHKLDRDFGSTNFVLNLKLRDNYLDDGITWNTNALDTIVTVILDDINDQIPKLPNISDPLIEISEITNEGAFVVKISAEDYDDPLTENTKINYKLLSTKFITDDFGNEIVEKCATPFKVETVNFKYAEIYTTQGLRGCYGTWAIELYAQDHGTDPGPLNDTKIYHIRVTDYNYYTPVILFPIKGKNIALSQDQSLHTQLKTYGMQPLDDFNASDADYGASGQVTFSISSENNDDEYFEVINTRENSGKLQMRKWPNFEQQSQFKFIVTATDGGNPLKNTSQEVTIIFVSSPDPQFNENDWTIWVKENKTGINYSIIIPEATDNINENGGAIDIYYFIDNKVNDYEFFNIDKCTRNLSVTKELDREQQEIMQINIIATADRDGPPREPKKKAILNIKIIVLDENDNNPIFETNFYSAGVALEDPPDKLIMTVKATDADLNDTLKYSMVSGSLITSDSSIAGIQNPFDLNSITGELLLKFSATSDMKGFFKARIIVHDTDIFGYTCNVDDIKSSVDANNQVLDNTTTLMTHFIDSKNNLPIASDVIILASSDLQTVTNLKATLQTKSLYLIDVPTGSLPESENITQTIQWILICLTIFFSMSSVALIVVYYIRTKR
ncbi:hypothetical protein PV325_002927 [Microctonus aethiopoides]|nr:hypothetical protein PV325_002927 [Microctonus aethiopoides]